MSRHGGILCLDIATDTGWAYGLPGDPAPVWGVWRLPTHVSRGAAGAALEDELEKKLDEYQPCRLVYEAPLPANLQTNAASAFMLIGMAFATESCAHRCEIPVFSRSSDTFRNAVIGRSHLHDNEKRERPRPTVKTRIVAPWIAARGWKIADHNAADAAVVCWCGRPPAASMCQNEVVVSDLRQRRPSVDQISRIGMDTSKHIFQLHGVNAAEVPVLRKKLRRKDMVAFFEKLAPTVIAIEACGSSHHLARLLQSFGHSVKLIAPQLVKPYVKRGKNDSADAEALCEAMSRPTMRFVPVKTAEQQAALMLVGVRDRLIRNRTQLINAIRGHAAEFGLNAAKGVAHLVPLLECPATITLSGARQLP